MPSITAGDQIFSGTFMGSLAHLRWTSSHFSVPEVISGWPLVISPHLFCFLVVHPLFLVRWGLSLRDPSLLSDKVLSDSSHLATCTQVSVWPGEFLYSCHATWQKSSFWQVLTPLPLTFYHGSSSQSPAFRPLQTEQALSLRLLGHLSDSPRTPRLCSDSKQLGAGLRVSVT